MATVMSAAGIQTKASAISSTVKHLGFNRCLPQTYAVFTHHSNHSLLRRRVSRRNLTVAMAGANTPLEVLVKASVSVPNKLGDFPFCQRVLLTLEEKHLPYDLKLVDLTQKPEWFLKINPEGKVPVIKLDEKWVADSDVITQSLEEKYQNPPLVAYMEWFKDLLHIYWVLSSNGKEVYAVDLSLGPKLYHLEIALGHYKNWSIPDTLSHVKSYTKGIFSRESFMKTRALPEDVITGWYPKVAG